LIFIVLILFSITNVFAFNFEDSDYGLTREEDAVITFNNNTGAVNSSENWVTTTLGTLNDANDTHFNNEAGALAIDQSWLSAFGNAIWCALTGCTMSGDINMGDNDVLNVNNITLGDSIKDTNSDSRMYFNVNGTFIIEG